jgi:hypothetical protein
MENKLASDRTERIVRVYQALRTLDTGNPLGAYMDAVGLVDALDDGPTLRLLAAQGILRLSDNKGDQSRTAPEEQDAW